MAVTLTQNETGIFTSDNENIFSMSSTLQNSPVFHFRVYVFKNGILAGTDKVYKNPNGIVTEYDLSIYTRYLTPLNEVVLYYITVTEMVNDVAGSSTSTPSFQIIKGWTDREEREVFQNNFESYFLTKFRSNRYASFFHGLNIYYGVYLADASTVIRNAYGANGALLDSSSSALLPAGLNVNLNVNTFSALTKKITIQILTSGVLKDEITFEAHENDCGNGVLQWLNEFGILESMYLFHNIIDGANFNKFEYSQQESNQIYLKTWLDGGTIYTDDIGEYEQKRLKNMMQSPSVSLTMVDEYGNITTRGIVVNSNEWKLNQTYYEDAESFGIPFSFEKLKKSLLL